MAAGRWLVPWNELLKVPVCQLGFPGNILTMPGEIRWENNIFFSLDCEVVKVLCE